jgi:hypothetical protein
MAQHFTGPAFMWYATQELLPSQGCDICYRYLE